MKNQITANHHWCKTALGTSIPLFQKTHTHEAGILFIGGVHGDEPEGVRLAEEFLKELVRMDQMGLETRSWSLIPCLNPDGYSRKERVNGNGVDLNRNFPSHNWSPLFEKPRYFPGPSPASEPEVKAVTQLIRDLHLQLIVHFHSWKPCIVYTGDPGKVWAEEIAAKCGYQAKPDIGYPTPGSLGDYGWNDLHTPVICIEEQEGAPLDTVWPRFEKALKWLVTSESKLK
jgi:predicted deacylase